MKFADYRRYSFLLALLVCSAFLLILPTGASANLTSEQVDRVQDRCQFRNPDGSGIPHDTLEQVLLKPYKGSTYLLHGIHLAQQLDLRDQHAARQYYAGSKAYGETTPYIAGFNPDWVDFAAAIAEGYTKYIGFTAAASTFQLSGYLYAGLQYYQLTLAVIDQTRADRINQLVRDYIASISDADNDDEEWNDYLFPERSAGVQASIQDVNPNFDIR